MPPLTPAKRRGRPPKAPAVPRHEDDPIEEGDDEEFVDEPETEEHEVTTMAKSPVAVTEEERREEAARVREEDQARKREEHEERKRLREEANAAAEEEMSGLKHKPTPTQDESDMVALGVDMVDKEPDGSPDEEKLQRALDSAKTEARAAYKTR
jgi:hypothetical protein